MHALLKTLSRKDTARKHQESEKKGKFHLHFPSLLEYVECACVLSFRLNIKIIMCDSKFGINCYCVRSGIHLFSGGRL